MLQVRALSLRQPWAEFVAEGMKVIETRTWSTRYRGSLLIVASKAKPDWDAVYWEGRNQEVQAQLMLRFGEALAITKLVDCRPMTKNDERAAMCKLYNGANAWVLSDTRKISPFPVKGQLGLFTAQLPKSCLNESYQGERRLPS
jgi:hypothetical protein